MNVALIGYGFAGKTFHAPILRRVAGLRLAAVVSSRAAEIEADLPGVRVLDSAEEAIGDPAIDLVVVATPNATHFDLARRALAGGKHVVVDKPFTVTTGEAVELAGLARAKGRLLSVFHNRRWDGDFLTVRRLVAEGRLGEIVHFESHYDRYRPVVQKRWRESGEPATGIWFDLGSHLADQALQLFGIPESVFADLGRQREGAAAVDYFHVLLRYGKLRVILHGSTLVAETVRRFEVHGAVGSFVVHGMDEQEEALKLGEAPGPPRNGVVTEWVDGAPRVSAMQLLPGNYGSYYEGVRDAIERGTPNPVTAEQAIAVMQVLELAERSAAEGRECQFG